MVIRKSFFTIALPQYLLIYCIAACSGSLLFVQNINMFGYGIIAFFILMGVFNRNFRNQNAIVFSAFLVFSIAFVRLLSGNIGVDAGMLNISQVLVVYCAFLLDKKNFLNRYVDCIAILALVSLGGWILQLCAPTILNNIVPTQQNLFNKSGTYTTTYHGLLFYVYSLTDSRNCGIYTEPGRYQSILHGALFILLLCPKYLNKSRRRMLFDVVIVILAIVSTQSTTGYLMLAIIMIGFVFTNKRQFNSSIKKCITGLVVLVTSLLIFDFLHNGSASLISSAVVKKLSETDANDMYSSGGARLRMIAICWNYIVTKPWGVGTISVLGNNVSAGILKYIGSLGVFPGIITLIWLFRPMFKYHDSKIAALTFVVIYIYQGLSQTYMFYSGLLVIPIVLNELSKEYIEEWRHTNNENQFTGSKI